MPAAAALSSPRCISLSSSESRPRGALSAAAATTQTKLPQRHSHGMQRQLYNTTPRSLPSKRGVARTKPPPHAETAGPARSGPTGPTTTRTDRPTQIRPVRPSGVAPVPLGGPPTLRVEYVEPRNPDQICFRFSLIVESPFCWRPVGVADALVLGGGLNQSRRVIDQAYIATGLWHARRSCRLQSSRLPPAAASE